MGNLSIDKIRKRENLRTTALEYRERKWDRINIDFFLNVLSVEAWHGRRHRESGDLVRVLPSFLVYMKTLCVRSSECKGLLRQGRFTDDLSRHVQMGYGIAHGACPI